jgi:prolyl-tRNA synthetase
MMHSSIDLFSSGLVKTNRDFSQDEESLNAQWLIRAGYISKLGAGIYSLLPLGVRVLQRIEDLIRAEMRALGGHEVLLPSLHPKDSWSTTGRWDTVDVLYKLASRHGAELCLGPTHEEIVTPLARQLIRSYRDLPIALFQLQTKFRDEARARSGLIRGREFRMKDMYSFHASQADLDSFYERATEAYHTIFSECGIGRETFLTFAGGGTFSRFSHEFQMLSDAGEDTVFVCRDQKIAVNKELIEDSDAMKVVFPDGVPQLEERRAVEVGNIFKLGTRFSQSFDLSTTSAEGRREDVIMGCYGIGTTRLMASVAQLMSDAKGLCWPRRLSPYDVHVVVLSNSEAVSSIVRSLCGIFQATGKSCLVDDRLDARAGEKFIDADMIGVPLQVIVGNRAETGGIVEIRSRIRDTRQEVKLTEVSVVLNGV